MSIDELIEKLQQVRAERGNLKVAVADTDWRYRRPVSQVNTRFRNDCFEAYPAGYPEHDGDDDELGLMFVVLEDRYGSGEPG